MKLNEAFTIFKPWGKEVLLNNPEKDKNTRYCYKRIYINAGHKTSLQKHEFKSETNYIISGQAIVILENDKGELEKYEMGPDEFFSVEPNKIHRVTAITDIILQECSTPEITDCLRLSDDYLRKDGKIEAEHQKPVVLILASGKGERVQKYSRNLHKGLLKIQGKAAISHIIESFSSEFEIIITLGYNGNILKNYVQTVHPDRTITFVNVENYEGENSGPGISAFAAKDLLNRPFYFTTVDCLTSNFKFPLISNENWIGITKTDIPELYSTAKVENSQVIDFINKTKFSGYDNAFIGLAYIFNYQDFWKNLEGEKEIIAPFIKKFASIKAKEITSFDIGTVDGYKNLCKISGDEIEEKTSEEQIYVLNNKVYKLNKDLNVNLNRFKRVEHIKELVPPNVKLDNYILSYDFIQGGTLYELDNLHLYKKFIDNVFITIEDSGRDRPNKPEIIDKFYVHKTIDRLSLFNKTLEDVKINFNLICSEVILYEKFHGDLQPDNIIYNQEKDKFYYIDWRPDFGGLTYGGDIYYDLGKLLGGLTFNYYLAKNLNNLAWYKEGYVLPTTENQKIAKQYFFEKIKKYNYNIEKIKEMRKLIWLNMTPIHKYPMADMLFKASQEYVD